MERSNIWDVDEWWREGHKGMIPHLEESISTKLSDDGIPAAHRAIEILNGFIENGFDEFYGKSGENFFENIRLLAELLEQIKIMIIHSSDDSYDRISKMLLPSFIDKIISGLQNGIKNPDKIADDDGFNAWEAIYIPAYKGGPNCGKIRPFMALFLKGRDDVVINAMIDRLSKDAPPQVFVVIFGKGHYTNYVKILKDNPHLVLESESKILFDKTCPAKKGGKKTRRRRKHNKKKKTKRRRKSRKKRHR